MRGRAKCLYYQRVESIHSAKSLSSFGLAAQKLNSFPYRRKEKNLWPIRTEKEKHTAPEACKGQQGHPEPYPKATGSFGAAM